MMVWSFAALLLWAALTAENAELKDPGMIGLWTKSDAASLFDDLSVAAP